jgi:transketolase
MTENIILRKTFGEYLEKLGAKAKNLVVLDSDLGNGLYTLYFAKSFPDRHFSVQMGEASALGMATGMTVRKKIPFVCAEAASLLGKGLDILRNGIAAPNLNIKIILSNIGLGNIEEGLVKTSTEDLALLQAIPNLKIFTPADQYELRAMMDFMINDYGPTVLRLCRHCTDNIFDQNYQFSPGQPVIANTGDQVCLISSGAMLHECLKAAAELEQKGLTTQVVNLSSIVPLDREKLADICRNYEIIVTAEDHNLHGGIGTLTAEILNQYGIPKKLIKIGLDNLPDSGKYQEILARNKLSGKTIYETVRENWLQN